MTPEDYAKAIFSGDRVILAKSISLVESNRFEDQKTAHRLLKLCLPRTRNSIRLAITGMPGAGKSTFIERFANYLISQERKKVAVLAVDPSSLRTGGSILGDKTRMPTLATNPKAFIRPSPSSGNMGGLAFCSRESMILCEAAGYNTILIETVGVGQSETMVHSMVDFFLLLTLAGGGDILQGIKRGIIEAADALVVTKADGANIQRAKEAQMEYQSALGLALPKDSGWKPPVLVCSAQENKGIIEIYQMIQNYLNKTIQNGYFEKNRKNQYLAWIRESMEQKLRRNLNYFFIQPEVQMYQKELAQKAATGKMSPTEGGESLLMKYYENHSKFYEKFQKLS